MRFSRALVLNIVKIMNKIEVSKEMNNLLFGIWHDRLTSKAVVFSYLCAKAFNVVRYPSAPDRSLTISKKIMQEVAELLDNYDEQVFDNLVEEIKRIKAQTKIRLFLNEDYAHDHVPLQRALFPVDSSQTDYALREEDNSKLFPLLYLAAKDANVKSFDMDVDIVSGWSTCFQNRYGSLCIEKDWHIDDIIMISDFISTKNNGKAALETNEWLCLNRNPNGLVSFATDNCIVEEAQQPIIENLSKKMKPRDYDYLQKECLNMASNRNVTLLGDFLFNLPKVSLSFMQKVRILFQKDEN